MSIKHRIPLLLLAALILYSCCMVVFYLFYENTAQAIATKFRAACDEVTQAARSSQDDSPALDEAVDALELSETYRILIRDDSGRTLLEREPGAERGLSLYFQEEVETGFGRSLRVDVWKRVDLQIYDAREELRKIALFGLFLMAVTLVVLYLYLHKEVSKPLVDLRMRMADLDCPHDRLFRLFPGDEIQLLNRGFDRMSEALDTSRRQQRMLFASITHDIRNPLTSILGYTERLMEPGGASPERLTKYLRIIHGKADDIRAMMDEFSMYMDAEAGNLSLTTELLAPFAASIAEEYTEELSGMGIPFHTRLLIPEDRQVRMDPVKLRRVFSNIVENAVRYAGPHLEIAMDFRVEEGFAVITMDDNGPGVPEAEWERIFDLMYRCGVDRNQNRDKLGSGLGLTICRQLVALHGGSIAAGRSPLGGLRIRFRLPVCD